MQAVIATENQTDTEIHELFGIGKCGYVVILMAVSKCSSQRTTIQ